MADNEKFKEGYLNAKSVYEMYNSEYEKIISKATYLVPVATFIAGGFLLVIKDLIGSNKTSNATEFSIMLVLLTVTVLIIIICALAIRNILKVLYLDKFVIAVFNETDLNFIKDEKCEAQHLYEGLIKKYIDANSSNKEVVNKKAEALKLPQLKLRFAATLIIIFSIGKRIIKALHMKGFIISIIFSVSSSLKVLFISIPLTKLFIHNL